MALEFGENTKILENNKIDYLLDLTTKNFRVDSSNQNEEFYNTLKQAIQNLLTKLEEEFNEDYSVFLLETLILKKSSGLRAYFANIINNPEYLNIENDCINSIFDEIEKIKEESKGKIPENEKNVLKSGEYEDKKAEEAGKKALKLIDINKKTYFQKYDFFKELSPELQDDLLKEVEDLNKEKGQEMVMKFETEINRLNSSIKRTTIDLTILAGVLSSISPKVPNLETAGLATFLTSITIYFLIKVSLGNPNSLSEVEIGNNTIPNFGISDKIKGILSTIRV